MPSVQMGECHKNDTRTFEFIFGYCISVLITLVLIQDTSHYLLLSEIQRERDSLALLVY